MNELIFFFSLFMVLYVYAGYPLAAAALGFVLQRRVHKQTIEPNVTVLIAAYNEEEVLGATIENKLAQDYPRDRLEILVVSDGSEDRTDAIVGSFADRGVRLLRQDPRAGKTSALNRAMLSATGDVVIFSDANSIYAPDALRRLVANFADRTVGYVTGRMIYANPDGSTIGDGCTTYMKYENALRTTETRLGSVVGVDGGIDAVRKELYQPMNADQLPDFVLPLRVIEQGYRVVYEPGAVLWEPVLRVTGDEYRMRVRVSLRAFWALFDMRKLLVPWNAPLFSWQLWSHKVLRYLCFIFLATSFVSNLMLLSKGLFYQIVFVLQVAGYLGALVTPVIERKGCALQLLIFARYFSLLNLAAAHAFGKFLLGKKQIIWTPRKG